MQETDSAELCCSLVELLITESSARKKVTALHRFLISTKIFPHLLTSWIFTDTFPRRLSLPA